MPLNVTAYEDCTFKPIPKDLPAEHNTTIFVGGRVSLKRPVFVLWKNYEEIVIQADLRLNVTDDELRRYEEALDYDSIGPLSRHYAECLQIIEDLLPVIEFGRSNWAYLVEGKGKHGPRLVYNNKTLTTLRTPSWTTPINTREVMLTTWGSCQDRRGWWRGKAVDVLYGWDDFSRMVAHRAIIGFEAITRIGLDFIFDVYGHLVKDGEVIGLVSEAAWGRPIGPADRALVYSAISELQAHGLIYKGCGTNGLMISEGKVRLVDLNLIVPFLDKIDQLEAEAEIWHWRQLEELFQEFEDFGPFGWYRTPRYSFTYDPSRIKRLYPTQSPSNEHFFFLIDVMKSWFWGAETFGDYSFLPITEEEEDQPVASGSIGKRRRHMLRLLTETDSTLKSTGDNDRSRSSRTRSHAVIEKLLHPYYRHRRPIGLRELTNSELSTSRIEEIP